MPTRKLMPDVIQRQELVCLSLDSTVRDAAVLMAERRIAAILVAEGRRLQGIFTERDLTVRVVAAGKDPTTRTVGEALELMERRRYRHLPVVDGNEVVGIVSIRDLFAVVREHLEHEIKDREEFMFGSGYSAGALP